MYTPEMRELIKKVEATRSKRLGHDFPRLSPEEKCEKAKRKCSGFCGILHQLLTDGTP